MPVFLHGCLARPGSGRRLGSDHLVRRVLRSLSPRSNPAAAFRSREIHVVRPNDRALRDARETKPQGPRAPWAEASSSPQATACPPSPAPGVVVQTPNPLPAESGAAWWGVGCCEQGEGVAGLETRGCSQNPGVASPGSHAEKLVASLRRSRDFGRKG